MAARRTPRYYTPQGGGPRHPVQNADGLAIRNVIAEAQHNGTQPRFNQREALEGDFRNPDHLQDQMERLQRLQDEYGRLPSTVRKASGNKLVEFYRMLETREGSQALVDAGLELDGFERTRTPAPETPSTDSAGDPSPSSPSEAPNGALDAAE